MVMEFMGSGCLTEVLEQFENGVTMDESQIANICLNVYIYIFFFIKK